MASISGKETKPEKLVRKFLFAKGLRFRKNVKSLPGRPDIVLPKYKTVIFVHGCFWHGHECKRGQKPTSNSAFWSSKIEKNIYRDEAILKSLKKMGWKVRTIWTCQISSKQKLSLVVNRIANQILKYH